MGWLRRTKNVTIVQWKGKNDWNGTTKSLGEFVLYIIETPTAPKTKNLTIHLHKHLHITSTTTHQWANLQLTLKPKSIFLQKIPPANKTRPQNVFVLNPALWDRKAKRDRERQIVDCCPNCLVTYLYQTWLFKLIELKVIYTPQINITVTVHCMHYSLCSLRTWQWLLQ